MLMPSIFEDTLLDDFFDFPTRESYTRGGNSYGLLQTDITENDKGYEVTMNLPGFKKEDVKGELKNGYLTITATTNTENNKKDQEGRYIRKERYSGTCSRSFYVGNEVTQDEIKAKFEDGTLKLTIPKKEALPEKDQSKYIQITG